MEGDRQATRAKDHARWLGEEPAEAPHLMAMLKAYSAEAMETYPVSPRVGNVKNTEAELFEPLTAQDRGGGGATWSLFAGLLWKTHPTSAAL